MSGINFYIKKADRKGQCPIMMTYQKNGEKFRYYTKLKIKHTYWKGQRVKAQYTGSQEMNSILDSFSETIKELEREALFLKKDYSLETIKRKFEIKVGKSGTETDFFKAFQSYINQSKSTKSNTTIKAYGDTRNRLLEFQASKNEQISFENINTSFYNRFVEFLIEKKYLNNTVGKHIKTLKSFLNFAFEHELTFANFNLRKFKVFHEEPEIIYLTDSELMRIYNLKDLTPTLEKVRDSFCFACFTGLRFSDISNLKETNVKNDLIEILTHKTKDFLRIPLNDYAKDILAKYRHNSNSPLPSGISNQKTNNFLKEISMLAEINDLVQIEKYNGSQKVVISKPKHEFICTHTARRTFVTLSLEKGFRAEVVMAMTGHKSYKTFKRYINITDKVMQKDMLELWKKPPLLKVV